VRNWYLKTTLASNTSYATCGCGSTAALLMVVVALQHYLWLW